MTGWLLGVDVGASGSRLSLVPHRAGEPQWAAARRLDGERLSVGPGGSSAAEVMLDLVSLAIREWPDVPAADIRGAAAGIAGFETVVADAGSYPERLRALLPHARVALCGDMVVAHLGALGGAGAVLAAGTGAIALGTDWDRHWHRVDGWGHLIGDLGSGAWIGMQTLQAAAAAADGRDPAGERLYRRIRERLGEVSGWPAAVYNRGDRAGALAEFARDAQAEAAEGDPAASRIIAAAAGHLADTFLAAFDSRIPRVGALVGGLVSAGTPLRAALLAELARRDHDLEIRSPLGTPLDGAVRLAALAATDLLPAGGPLRR